MSVLENQGWWLSVTSLMLQVQGHLQNGLQLPRDLVNLSDWVRSGFSYSVHQSRESQRENEKFLIVSDCFTEIESV